MPLVGFVYLLEMKKFSAIHTLGSDTGAIIPMAFQFLRNIVINLLTINYFIRGKGACKGFGKDRDKQKTGHGLIIKSEFFFFC